MECTIHSLRYSLVHPLTHLPRGVAVGGSGGSNEPPPPPRAGKGPQKIGLFFFLSGIAQESVFVERTKGRRQQKTSHARRGMARLTFEWHFAQTPSPPKKTIRRAIRRRPACMTRRGQVRMPNAVLSGRYTSTVLSVELNINGERPAAAAQTDKRTAQMPSYSVESC